MDPLYGVLGMMAVIVVITIALVRAPRRTHRWQRPDARSGGDAPRSDEHRAPGDRAEGP